MGNNPRKYEEGLISIERADEPFFVVTGLLYQLLFADRTNQKTRGSLIAQGNYSAVFSLFFRGT
jgi:hypothetical protein